MSVARTYSITSRLQWAATVRSRIAVAVCHGRSRVELQWGRDREVADRLIPIPKEEHQCPLQWGRDREVADRLAADARLTVVVQLQWGRDREVPDRHPNRPQDDQRGKVSMGPRP